MKKGDFLWILILGIIVYFMVSSNVYSVAVSTKPYLVGFIKFFILATMGELLANRIILKKWEKTLGMVYKAIMWGFYGMLITLMFKIFASGTTVAMESNMLPGGNNNLLFAFFASSLMNLFFAPVMMGMHKITDTYIDMKLTEESSVTIKRAIAKVDWVGFVDFIVLKTIPIFWIPAHTISFLMPDNMRVMLAALLSIAFGVIMAYSKLKKSATKVS